MIVGSVYIFVGSGSIFVQHITVNQVWIIDTDLIGESIYDQKPPNPPKIDTKGFLTDSGRICHVKWHTKSLPESDIGKGVTSKMASKMGVTILK